MTWAVWQLSTGKFRAIKKKTEWPSKSQGILNDGIKFQMFQRGFLASKLLITFWKFEHGQIKTWMTSLKSTDEAVIAKLG